MVKSFNTLGGRGDADALLYLQSKYGSTNYSDWQSLRKQFYSYVAYPEAGSAQFTFFGNAVGSSTTATKQITNLPKANSFGQVHFLLKAIRTRIWCQTQNMLNFDGLDANNLYADLIFGFAQAGYLDLQINSRSYVQIVKPFLYAPPADGEADVHSAGVASLTLNEAAPNTLATLVSPVPSATQTSKKDGIYQCDPNILIEAEQNFQCTINYPAGVIPVIATAVTDDTTNPLYIGVQFDGIVFRPVQ